MADHSEARYSRYESQSRNANAARRVSQQRRTSGHRDPSTGPDYSRNPRSPEATHRSRRRSNSRTHEGGHTGTARARRPSHGQHSSTPRGPRTQLSSQQLNTPYNYSPAPSPGFRSDHEPILEAGTPSRTQKASEIGRKKSMIRPERRRIDPEDPDYYYRKHAAKMNVMPSTTGRDPQFDEDVATIASESTALRKESMSPTSEKALTTDPLNGASKRQPNKLTRKGTVGHANALERRKLKATENSGTPSLWTTYCHLVTFWCPNAFLRCCGMGQKQQQRAWREKIGLISIIMLVMTFVGYLTFGFTATVCPQGGPMRLQVNKVGNGYMIFHGEAYDLTRSHHPLARGIASGGNVLWDMQEKHGGQDGSFLFQNVNGACKGLIEPAPNSDVPYDSDGNMAWYFPCNTFNQDGSSNANPNLTIPYYLGYACHTSKEARGDFYSLRSSGEVFFTWDDIRNSSRNLMVYSGDVLDLDLLKWFNKTQVAVPSLFEDIRTNPAVRGIDTTLAFSSGPNKQVAECFQEIIKVGSIDTETVGCIASKVVLYVSLIFILGIVGVKFLFALLFQWFLCRKYAAIKTSMPSDAKKRNQQIEEWSDDIYRPAPKMTDPGVPGDRMYKRNSFLPTTSRFSSPYAIDQSLSKSRPAPTTMASQQSTSRLLSNNKSEVTLSGLMDGKSTDKSSYLDASNITSGQRYSSVIQPETDVSGPQGFIHDSVVPQPPPEWQPFGYPLAHTICLVTAYSEGPEGIRTTLDSIAMTDYPNSHKLLFIVADGIIKGKGESMSTPDACLSMMKDHTVLPEEVEAFSYVAVASGSKRHNMAKVYAGFYDYGNDSIVPVEKQQRVPVLLIVKCGTPEEASASKPGNRGKRDSQIVLMSFLQKVMFDERMTELEYEMFNGIWKITGISPDFYETCLMVDADTKVFPDSLTHMNSAMVKDPEIMGLCGETKIANKTQSWVTMIQVFEYFISHHQAKSFESVFGGVTCLPGCFSMYRIKTPKGGQNYWVPILANPDIVEHYSENVVDTLHKKNLLLLGEDRYLSTLMLKTFPKRKQVFVPQAVCKTTVPDEFKVLLSQRRRWINSTMHNLMELVLVRDLCGTFCFSMQFVVFIDLVGTVVLPAAISFTVFLIVKAVMAAVNHTTAPTIPLVLLALILGLPGVLIVITAHRVSYVLWMLVYLMSLPIWNFVLPTYAFWHFDDFSWGDTRQTAGEVKGAGKGGHDADGEFDSSKITMKRWADFEQDRRLRQPGFAPTTAYTGSDAGPYSNGAASTMMGSSNAYEKRSSNLAYSEYHDYS
ncbi:Chitin synthase 4 [Acrodontium crateriforme]|uniref:chitin synthase n=1 Tax=Acrodontium crateriforme TaxID=150365 RepID=A0AAQ3M8X7_9PEZI|nr:Chitin synthase 4 [Acrodontium crateriforme]